jgi:hypothetical protein
MLLLSQVADEVLAAGPVEDHVLNTLALVLKPSGRVRELAEAAEAAAARAPRNEELMRSCFHCYLR